MDSVKDEQAVRKSIVVECSAETAFRVFTRRTGDWWPFEGHSLYNDGRAEVVFEDRVGGRVFERSPAGEEGDWGTLTAWDPPRSFSMTWHPGRAAETAQELEVTFTPAEGEGRTRIDVLHSGWERLGPGAGEAMLSYDRGWDGVLGAYARRAAADAASGDGARSGT